jgi:hypothetical protein
VTSAVGRRAVLLASFVFSQAVLFVILRMPPVPGDGSWLKAFRGYFAFDQFSYAAIASSTAAGSSGLTEPFTETGYSYYPSLWYRVLGWLAALTGLSVPTVWTVAGGLVLAAAVVLVGFVGYRISGRAWAPALVGPAMAVGTLSVVLHDEWNTLLESHATLWGPFGALYALNAEVVGFACVASGLALALRVAAGPPLGTRSRIALLTTAALLLGITANVQTYTFFVGAGIAFAWAGAYGLIRSRSRALLVISIVLVPLAFVAGPAMATRIGALPVYGLLILITLPGAGWLGWREWRSALLPVIVFVVAAAPQAAVVASGILRKDAFLTYRQDASYLLGVPLWAGFLAALPVIAIWLFNATVQRRHRHDGVLAALIAMAFSGTMLTFNGAWGFGQEPYRMMIDSLTISLLLLAPITAWSVARLTDEPRTSVPALVRVTAVVAVVLVGASFLDVGAYRTYVLNSGVIRFDDARYQAMAALTADVDGLLANGPCIDPQEMKIATRLPVPYYNTGIAWPENKAQIDGVLDASTKGVFDPDAMRAAGVGYLMTDSSCATQWPVDGAMGIVKVGTKDYSDDASSGTLTLWRIA